MCISIWAHTSQFALALASNRDEFLHRPTAPAHWHSHGSWDVLSGTDLEAGGTWLGVAINRTSKTVRIANLTNLSDPRIAPPIPENAVSRGSLVLSFLTGDHGSPHNFAQTIEKSLYAGFNLYMAQWNVHTDDLISYTVSNALYGETEGTSSAVNGMSNGSVSVSDWPKVSCGCKLFHDATQSDSSVYSSPLSNTEDLQSSQISSSASNAPSLSSSEQQSSDMSITPASTQRLVSRIWSVLAQHPDPPVVNSDLLKHTILVVPFFAGQRGFSGLSMKTSGNAVDGAGGIWYGTRAQTVVLFERNTRRVVFVERQAYNLDSSRRPSWDGAQRVFTFVV